MNDRLYNRIAPFFSIIIPTLNPSIDTLLECICSISSQTLTDWEIIVIDADSPQSAKVKQVCQYTRKALYYPDAKKRGVYGAMNKAVKYSQGEWILFLGHNDRLIDDKVLENCKKQITMKSAFSWKKAFYGNTLIEGDAEWAQDGQVYDGKFCFYKLTSRNICHQAIFYRGKSARRHRLMFSEQFAITADWEYNIRAWTSGGMVYMPILISAFKGGGLSSSNISDGFHGNHTLAWHYWKTKRVLPLAIITLLYCRTAMLKHTIFLLIARNLFGYPVPS